MNASVSTQELNHEQTIRVKALVDTALSGYLKKNPTVNDATNFTIAVGKSIITSVLKNGEKNDQAKRVSRNKTVDELAANKNVKFLHNRATEIIENLVGFEQITKTLHEELYEVTEQNATLGGETLAYVYELDSANNLFLVYSTAFCRNDENFDPLIGKEESLKKFLAGDVLKVQVTHERLGPVKLGQLVDSYKRNENAKLEALKAKSTAQ